MPPAKPSFSNRAMFWRILRRFITGNPGRLTVMLLALSAGATITAALLNLKVDAQRRLTTEFTAFGPNVLVLPRNSSSGYETSQTLPESIVRSFPVSQPSGRVVVSSALYLVASVSVRQSGKSSSVVVAGANPFVFAFRGVVALDRLSASADAPPNEPPAPKNVCVAGVRVAQQLGIQQDAELVLANVDRHESCHAASFNKTGGPEDDRIAIGLRAAQRLADLPGRISAVQLRVPGTPQEISSYIADLQQRLPDADVRPIRQFTEGEARIYNRVSGVLTATVVLVLVLTALCVMAAMTNVAMERRNDVGLMKAIGGATRRVLRLFLVEAALLGLASGVVGAALGIALSMWLGKAVFGLAARPRLIVYPVAVALTVIVAIAGAYPLRRLANIRPASVFRGEA
jgi:putative ABC transport system permease protein